MKVDKPRWLYEDYFPGKVILDDDAVHRYFGVPNRLLETEREEEKMAGTENGTTADFKYGESVICDTSPLDFKVGDRFCLTEEFSRELREDHWYCKTGDVCWIESVSPEDRFRLFGDESYFPIWATAKQLALAKPLEKKAEAKTTTEAIEPRFDWKEGDRFVFTEAAREEMRKSSYFSYENLSIGDECVLEARVEKCDCWYVSSDKKRDAVLSMSALALCKKAEGKPVAHPCETALKSGDWIVWAKEAGEKIALKSRVFDLIG